MIKFKNSEITPENIYKNRRSFIKKFGLAAGSVFLSQNFNVSANALSNKEDLKLTEYRYVTTYNNYYEFGTGKNHPVERSQKFKTKPWDLVVDGEVETPLKLSMEEGKSNNSNLNESTEAGSSQTDIGAKNAAKDGAKKKPLEVPERCRPLPTAKMQKIVQNLMLDVQELKKSKFDRQSILITNAADIDAAIQKKGSKAKTRWKKGKGS